MTGKQRAFLAAFAQSGIITHAARMAKIERKSHTNWLANPEYAAAFADAKEEAIESMEWMARQRAMRINKPSDLLLIFMLKAARPEKYRDNSTVNLSGPGGGPLTIRVEFVKPEAQE